jgi:hypothetical protein
MKTRQIAAPRKLTDFMAHHQIPLALLGFIVSVVVFGR